MIHVGHGVELAYSPDGIHWTCAPRPLVDYHSDTFNHVVHVYAPGTVMYPDEGYSLENCDPIVTDSFQIAK